MMDQRAKIVAKFTANHPNNLTIEFLDGPVTGKMVNTYTDVSGGTKVVTECDMKSKLMDEKQLESAIRQFLSDRFDDDVRYPNKMK